MSESQKADAVNKSHDVNSAKDETAEAMGMMIENMVTGSREIEVRETAGPELVCHENLARVAFLCESACAVLGMPPAPTPPDMGVVARVGSERHAPQHRDQAGRVGDEGERAPDQPHLPICSNPLGLLGVGAENCSLEFVFPAPPALQLGSPTLGPSQQALLTLFEPEPLQLQWAEKGDMPGSEKELGEKEFSTALSALQTSSRSRAQPGGNMASRGTPVTSAQEVILRPMETHAVDLSPENVAEM